MMRTRYVLSVCLIWVSATVLLAEGPYTVTHSVSPSVATLGDVLTYEFKALYEPEYRFVPPSLEPFFKNQDVHSFKDDNGEEDGKRYYKLVYQFSLFELGEYTIPTQNTQFYKEEAPFVVTVPAQRFTIKSLLQEQAQAGVTPELAANEEGLKADIDIRKTTASLLKWLGVTLVILLLVVWIGWRLVRRYIGGKRSESWAKKPVDKRAPWEIALEALDRLEQAGLTKKGRHKSHYFRLSMIVRGYFSRLYNEPIVEMSSHEMLALLEARVDEQMLRRIRRVVDTMDVVKFSSFETTEDDDQDVLDRCRDIVNRMQPKEELVTGAVT